MLDVHLYFVKLFGCQIIEGDIPMDIKLFSFALLNRVQCDQLYLAFGPSTESSQRKKALVTAVHAIDDPLGRTVFAQWVYMLGELAVTITYSESPEYVRTVPNAWRPSEIQKVLRLSDFKGRPYLRRALLPTRAAV